MLKKLISLFKDERGEDMIEYALLVSFIAIIALVGVTLVGNTLLAVFNSIAAKL